MSERETQVAVLEHKIATLSHEKVERDKLIEHLRADLAASTAAAMSATSASGALELELSASRARAEAAESDLQNTRKHLEDVEAALASSEEALRAERAALTGSLEEARAERRVVDHELDLLRRARHAEGLEIKAENDALRHEIERVAAQLIAVTGAGNVKPDAQEPRPERRKVRLAAVERRRPNLLQSCRTKITSVFNPLVARAKSL